MENINNTIKNKEIYYLEKSYDNETEKCIHVPIEFAKVGNNFYFDVDVSNNLSDKILEKYPNHNFTGKRDIVYDERNKNYEYVFFYQ